MKRTSFRSLIIGILIGAILAGGASAIASGIIAEPTKWKFFADGKPVSIEAYNIDGANYMKVRDVLELVDTGVWFDAAKFEAYIERDKKYDANYTGPRSDTSPTPSNSFNNDIEPESASLCIDNGIPRLWIEFKNNTNKDIIRFDIEVNCFDAYNKPVSVMLTNTFEGYTQKLLSAYGAISEQWYLEGFTGVQRVDFCVTKYATSNNEIVEVPISEQEWYYVTMNSYSAVRID